jgi:F0F1-type ATP synthase assembly protein I
MTVVVITDEAKATARRALTFVVRIFVNDTIAITVWASFCFHVSTSGGGPAFGTPVILSIMFIIIASAPIMWEC